MKTARQIIGDTERNMKSEPMTIAKAAELLKMSRSIDSSRFTECIKHLSETQVLQLIDIAVGNRQQLLDMRADETLSDLKFIKAVIAARLEVK